MKKNVERAGLRELTSGCGHARLAMLVTSDWRCRVATWTYESGALGSGIGFFLSARAGDPDRTLGPPPPRLAAAAGTLEQPGAVLTWSDPALCAGIPVPGRMAAGLRGGGFSTPALEELVFLLFFHPGRSRGPGWGVQWPGKGEITALCAAGRVRPLVWSGWTFRVLTLPWRAAVSPRCLPCLFLKRFSLGT